MALSIILAKVRVKTYSKTYGMFNTERGIELRINANQLRLSQLSSLTSEFRRISKETRDLIQYREAIVRLRLADSEQN